MRTQCHSKPLEFEGHCSRRRLVAKELISLLVFLRVASWSFVPLRGYFFLITHKFQPQLTGDRATEESAQRHERVEEPNQRVGSGG